MKEDNLHNNNVVVSVQVDGKETQFAPYVVSVDTSTELHKLATAEIILRDGGLDDTDFIIGESDCFEIGKEITVMVGNDKADNCIFRGLIELQSIQLEENETYMKVTAKHAAYRMTLERKFRTFEDSTDKDIIQQICSEYNIAVKMADTNVQHEKQVQYNCSDWDFINMRAEAMGLVLYTGPDGIVIEKPNPNANAELAITNGYNLCSMDMEMDARSAAKEFKVDIWNYTIQDIENVSENTGNWDVSQGSLKSLALADKNGISENHMYQMTHQENPDIAMAANVARSMRNQLSRIVGQVEIWGYAPLLPLHMVEFRKIGKRFNGAALVSAVYHRIDGQNWRTTLSTGLSNIPYVECYNNISTAPADGQIPAANGLQIAIVKALEGDPLGEERIQVALMNNKNALVWARLALLDAGNERGTAFCPEIEDEVVVGFINDNPNQAVVLGMLHSSSIPSPIAKSNDNHHKGIISREKLQILMDDEKKILTLSTPGGNKLVLDEDQGGICMEDQNGNKITMDSNGITLVSDKAITIKAKQDISVEGNNVNAKANAQLKLEGTAGSELSASGNTVVKGAIVKIN